jgi:hypothetical protein
MFRIFIQNIIQERFHWHYFAIMKPTKLIEILWYFSKQTRDRHQNEEESHK